MWQKQPRLFRFKTGGPSSSSIPRVLGSQRKASAPPPPPPTSAVGGEEVAVLCPDYTQYIKAGHAVSHREDDRIHQELGCVAKFLGGSGPSIFFGLTTPAFFVTDTLNNFASQTEMVGMSILAPSSMDQRRRFGLVLKAWELQHLRVSSIKRQKDKIDIWTLIILSVDLTILSLSKAFWFLQFHQFDKWAIFLHS